MTDSKDTDLVGCIMTTLKKTIRAWLLILLLLSLVLACSSLPNVVVEVLPQYDALFSNQDGWTGADGAYSVALTPDMTAWFFGDTWVGQIIAGRHANATLVNNSVAIQRGKIPATAKVDFYYARSDEGQPKSLFIPVDGRGWFWVFDGVMTPKGLYIFLMQIERTGRDTVFDFNVIGTWLGHVDNPKEPPTSWRVRQFKIPWTRISDSGSILFGSAILKVENFLYIYGTAEKIDSEGRRKHMILARAPLSGLADFALWRFYDQGSWVSDFTRASRLAENVSNEYSVNYLAALKQYALVYSQDGISKNILARLAPAPQGPFGDPILLYQCPEAEWDDTIFCYAAKGHTMFSEAPNQLVITYIANSLDFNKTASDARLYRPRFLRAVFLPQ
jgi:hypothetical protein